MIDVMVIDDHPMVIEGIRSLLANSSIFTLTSSAVNGYEALTKIDLKQPEIVLTDINLPDLDGIELCRKIKDRHPLIRVLGLSTFKERSYITRMIQAGASGYVLKNVSGEELEDALTTVMKGRMYLSEEVTGVITGVADKDAPPILTAREKEVLMLIAEGLTNLEIASSLFISPLTVDTHRKNLLTKLGVKNTALMIRKAVEWGFLK